MNRLEIATGLICECVNINVLSFYKTPKPNVIVSSQPIVMSMANFHPTVIIVGFSIKIIYTGMHGIPDPHLYTAEFED